MMASLPASGNSRIKPSTIPAITSHRINQSTNQRITNPYLTFILVLLVGQLSPGPDFLLVVKNALNHGLRGGLFTVAGISTGLVVHASAAAAGLSVFLSVSPRLYRVLLVAGALYLGWLGIKLLLPPRTAPAPDAAGGDAPPPVLGDAAAFREGLVTNLLNPKVVLFFSSILAQFLRPDSPPIDRVLFPAILVVEGVLVWCLLAFLLQMAPVRNRFLRYRRPINALFGVLLLGVASATLVHG
jgi:threonine/homoserine/homoserine lactone efflux protein